MKKLLSVFMMVALLLTSLSPAFLVIAADNLTAGNETHNYNEFTVYMDDVSVQEGDTKADVGLYWAGNTAENNPKDVAAAQMFVYYPKTLTFTGFTSSDAIPASNWENSEKEYALTQSVVNGFLNAPEAFAACGVEVATGETSDYKFVQLLLDRDIKEATNYNGLLTTMHFDIAADAKGDDVYTIGIAAEPLLFNDMDAKSFDAVGFVNGSVTVKAKPVVSGDTTVAAGVAAGVTGGEVTVPVKLDANAGIFIARMSLDYNHDVFSVKEITAGDVFADPNHFLSSVDANGNITLYFEAGDNADVTATGTLAYVTFNVGTADKLAGDYTFTPTYTEILNYAEEDVEAKMVPGTVTIGISDTMKVEVAEVSGPRFQEVKVPVSVGRNTEGVWAIRAEFAYDKSALEFKGVEDGLFSVADGYSEADGVITVFIEKEEMQNVTDTEGVLYTLKFMALTEGVSPIRTTVKEVVNMDEKYVDCLSVDGSVNVTPCEHIHGTYTAVTKKPTMYEEGVLSTLCNDCDVELSSEPIAKVPGLSPQKTEGDAGAQVKVPVNLLNNPGLVAIGAEFVYNPDEVTFAGLESGLFNADQFSVSDKDGKITVYVESPSVTNITENGTAFYMLFDIPEDGQPLQQISITGAPIADNNINEDEEIVYIEVDNGIIEVNCPHAELLPPETIEPTCTEPGMIVVKCALCGEIVKSEIDPEHPEALGHEEGPGVVTKEATCTEKGEMTYYCIRGDKIMRTEEIPMLDHTEGPGVVTKEATCTEKGEMTYYCTVCDNVVRTEEIPMLPHTEGPGVVTKEATCTEEGIMTYTCTVCGNEVRTEPIAKLDHVEDEGTITKEATCTEKGIKTYHCKIGGEVLRTEEIEMIPHIPGDWVIGKQPTEAEDGYKTISCTVCGNELERQVIPATGPDDTTVPDPDDTTVPDPDDTTVPDPDDTTVPDPDDTTVPGPDDTTVPGPDDTTVPNPDETTKKPVDSTTDPGNKDKNPPKTGDYMVYIIIVAAVCVVGCIAVVVIRKKKTSGK